MDLGVHFMNFTLDAGDAAIPTEIADTARAAEDAGFAWFTVMDHWFQMEAFAPATDPMLEGYSTLAYVAALTERITLGTLVTGITYRNPGLLVQTATTLDVLSRGRAMFGVGAAWYEREHIAHGVNYPPISERFERLEETLQIAKQMWSDDDGPFDGEHYQLAETLCHPAPVHGSLPILIGGSGERKTLRLVAQYGDICNLFGGDVETISHKIDVLKAHCDTLGRDFSEIKITMQGQFGDPIADPEGFVEAARGYAALGVSHAQLRNPTADQAAWVHQIGETVLPRLAEL
jgi:F420-dependent oxidoreductase-like protein